MIMEHQRTDMCSCKEKTTVSSYTYDVCCYHIITRDDVVSQRLKFGSAFLWISWESKIALFF